MANVRQDRVPNPTLERASVPTPGGTAVNGREATPRNFLLSVHLRTQDSSDARGDVSWAVDSPPATLAIDVVLASGGATDQPQGSILSARFVDLPSALLAARRLQWAFEGLGESAGSRNAAASIAIHSTEDPASSGVVPLLDQVGSGQVLVLSRIADAVQQLPGITLRSTIDGNWRELQWRSVETPPGYSADEQSILGLIRTLGREDPTPPQVEAPRATAVSQPAAIEAPETLGRSVLDPEPETAFAKRKWLIMAGAAAVVVLVFGLITIVFGGHGKTTAPNPDAATKTTAPPANVTAPPAPPPAPPVADKPPKAQAKPGKQSRTEAKVEQPALSKTPSGPCNLTEAEIPRSLSRAENYMYAGKLDEAEAVYQRIQGCPSAHEKALEGLQRVHQRRAAQSP